MSNIVFDSIAAGEREDKIGSGIPTPRTEQGKSSNQRHSLVTKRETIPKSRRATLDVIVCSEFRTWVPGC